jgi:hypothetical protein
LPSGQRGRWREGEGDVEERDRKIGEGTKNMERNAYKRWLHVF